MSYIENLVPYQFTLSIPGDPPMDVRTFETIPQLLPRATKIVYNKNRRSVQITTSDGDHSFLECSKEDLEKMVARADLPYKLRISNSRDIITATRTEKRVGSRLVFSH